MCNLGPEDVCNPFDPINVRHEDNGEFKEYVLLPRALFNGHLSHKYKKTRLSSWASKLNGNYIWWLSLVITMLYQLVPHLGLHKHGWAIVLCLSMFRMSFNVLYVCRRTLINNDIIPHEACRRHGVDRTTLMFFFYPLWTYPNNPLISTVPRTFPDRQCWRCCTWQCFPY